LGLKLETVSRTFSKFVEDGLVEVKQRHVRILDSDGLQRLVNHNTCH
jgi:CRP/FNR family transcriptional regulator